MSATIGQHCNTIDDFDLRQKIALITRNRAIQPARNTAWAVHLVHRSMHKWQLCLAVQQAFNYSKTRLTNRICLTSMSFVHESIQKSVYYSIQIFSSRTQQSKAHWQTSEQNETILKRWKDRCGTNHNRQSIYTQLASNGNQAIRFFLSIPRHRKVETLNIVHRLTVDCSKWHSTIFWFWSSTSRSSVE